MTTNTSAPTKPEQPQQPQQPDPITLDTPIQRKGQTIKELTLRRPLAGELRGISLVELAQMDVAALERVLPRITTPNITQPEVAQMSLADLVQLGTTVAGFLLTKEQTGSATA